MKDFFLDLRYSFRLLRKDPTFAILSIVSIVIGIAVNATLFTLVDAVALKPLPVREPNEVVRVYRWLINGSRHDYSFSWREYSDLREHETLFSGLIAEACCFRPILGLTSTDADRPGVHVSVAARMVSVNYFSVLGIPPAVGRTFLPQDDLKTGGSPVIVISHGFWERYFGSDVGVVGKLITLNGNPFMIAGVARADFVGTASPPMVPDVWVPAIVPAPPGIDWISDPDQRTIRLIGRLKPGVTMEKAGADLSVLVSQFPPPRSDKERTLSVTVDHASFFDTGTGMGFTLVVAIILSVAAIVLMIACADVSNLLLARGAGRRMEISVRLAIGASRKRLIRQLLTESMVMAALGGSGGLLLSMLLSRSIASVIQESLRQIAGGSFIVPVNPDARVFFYTVALAAGATVLFGLAPALQASRPDLVSALKGESSPLAGRNRRVLRFRFSEALIVAQVAISMVLLVGAGLLVDGLARALSTDPGFEADHLITAEFDFAALHYDETRQNALVKNIADTLRLVPGMHSVAYAEHIPVLGSGYTPFLSGAGQNGVVPSSPVAYNVVSPEFLQTIGIPIVSGRDFMRQDSQAPAPTVIVSEGTAQRLWPGENPIGKQIRTERFPVAAEVVGVARDARNIELSEEDRYYLYYCMSSKTVPKGIDLIVRTSTSVQSVLRPMDQALEALDPKLILASSGIHPMRDVFDLRTTPRRIAATVASGLGLIALVLAVAGIYGITAYRVSQRVHEIGIRMALGAERSSVVRLVMRQSMIPVIIGVLLGLLGSVASSPVIGWLLFDPRHFDIASVLLVSALFIAIAVSAALIPSRKATAVNPIIALRQ